MLPCKVTCEESDDDNRKRELLPNIINEPKSLQLVELGVKHFQNGEYHNAYQTLQSMTEECIIAKYLVAIILYSGSDQLPSQPLDAVKIMYDVFVQSQNDPTLKTIGREIKHASCYLLGVAHYIGVGVNHNYDVAAQWWSIAAEELLMLPGDSDFPIVTDFGLQCQTCLAKYYLTERRDPLKSFIWHNEACNNGHLESKSVVGTQFS